MKRSFRIVSCFLVLVLTISLGVGAFAEGHLPSDVKEGKWYTDAVEYVLTNKLMENVSEDKFDPNGELTRATLYQSFYNSEKGSGTLEEALDWCKEVGIYDGEEFNGEEAVSRLEMFEALYKYMKYKDISTLGGSLEYYSDGEKLPETAIPIMEYLLGTGIVKGKDGVLIDADAIAKRSELARIHYDLPKLLTASTSGVVTVVDKYGNITLDLRVQNLLNAGFEFGDNLIVKIGEHEIEAPFVTAYSDVDNGSELVRGPNGTGIRNIIIAINMGNFAETYKVKEGDKVSFELKEKGGYLTEWEIRQLDRSNNREDYASDVIFANFRNVTTGNIAPGVYYRSSSPVNNELGRAAYADALAKEAGIKTVVNLADSKEELESYFEEEDFNSPYYKSLYEEGNVILLDMGVDFKSDEFKQKLKTGLEFMIERDGPYLVHCTEGKDRAGFVAGLLEALMGSTVDEIKEDYMITYMNYYGVEYGSEQYEKIAESNILQSLRDIAGLEKGADLTDVDLEKAAEEYLLDIGLTKEQIKTLKEKLSTSCGSVSISSVVAEVQTYGHLTLEMLTRDMLDAGFKFGDVVTIQVGDNLLEAPFVTEYSDVDSGELLVRGRKDPLKNVSVCINYGDFSKTYNVGVNDTVTITLKDAGAYFDEWDMRQLERTNNREDYSTDAVFANFRNVTAGNIAPGMYYRSSSPVNNELGRAAYADALAKEAGIKTVVNLADSKEELESYFEEEDFNSPYYKSLYEEGNIILLDMAVDYTAEDFKSKLKIGVEFMLTNEGPYLVHCNEGKDRAGFVAALFEALTGASLEEIKDDYMLSYMNYYNVEHGSEKYEKIADANVFAMFRTIAGLEKDADLKEVDLVKVAENYLKECGLTEEQIKTLKEKLSTDIVAVSLLKVA